jgi:hypothetical protein
MSLASSEKVLFQAWWCSPYMKVSCENGLQTTGQQILLKTSTAGEHHFRACHQRKNGLAVALSKSSPAISNPSYFYELRPCYNDNWNNT